MTGDEAIVAMRQLAEAAEIAAKHLAWTRKAMRRTAKVLWQNGYTEREIANLARVSSVTVHNWLRRKEDVQV